MPLNCPFTIKIDTTAEIRRYRWSIYEGGELRGKSVMSFAKKDEANADAIVFLQRLMAHRPRHKGAVIPTSSAGAAAR